MSHMNGVSYLLVVYIVVAIVVCADEFVLSLSYIASRVQQIGTSPRTRVNTSYKVLVQRQVLLINIYWSLPILKIWFFCWFFFNFCIFQQKAVPSEQPKIKKKVHWYDLKKNQLPLFSLKKWALVERCIGFAEVMGSNPVVSLFFSKVKKNVLNYLDAIKIIFFHSCFNCIS